MAQIQWRDNLISSGWSRFLPHFLYFWRTTCEENNQGKHEIIYFGAVYIRLRIKISPELFCYVFFFIGWICYTWRIDSSLMFTQVPHFNFNRLVIDMFLCENLVRLNCVFLIFSWPDKVKYSDVCDLRVRLWLSDCFDRDLVTWGENVRIIDFQMLSSNFTACHLFIDVS